MSKKNKKINLKIVKKQYFDLRNILDDIYDPVKDNKDHIILKNNITRIELDNLLKDPNTKNKLDAEIDLTKNFSRNQNNLENRIYKLELDVKSLNGLVFICKKSFSKKSGFLKDYFQQFKLKLGKNIYKFNSNFYNNKQIENEKIGIMVVSNQNINEEKSYCEIKNCKLDVIKNDIIYENKNDNNKLNKNKFSGRNDEPQNKEDLLDYKTYAQILGDIIVKKTITPPVTFGIYSSWGSGKSFLLNEIENYIKSMEIKPKSCCKICRNYEKTRKENYVFIKFNAWEYSGSDILWAGLVKCLYDQVENEFGYILVRLFLNYFEPIYFYICEFFKFLCKLLFFIIGYIIYLNYKDYISGTISLISGIVITFFTIFPNIKKFFYSIYRGESKIIQNQMKTIESKIGFMAIVKEKLNKLRKLLNFFNCQAIIFIDDLDRCTNDKAVDVLNAVKLLLAENNFYTFIAVDPRLIINAIESKYSDSMNNNLINGYEFMDKIIQIPFSIPEQDNENKKNFIVKILNELIDSNQLFNFDIENIFDEVKKIRYDQLDERLKNHFNIFYTKKEDKKLLKHLIDKWYQLKFNDETYNFYMFMNSENPKGKIFIYDSSKRLILGQQNIIYKSFKKQIKFKIYDYEIKKYVTNYLNASLEFIFENIKKIDFVDISHGLRTFIYSKYNSQQIEKFENKFYKINIATVQYYYFTMDVNINKNIIDGIFFTTKVGNNEINIDKISFDRNKLILTFPELGQTRKIHASKNIQFQKVYTNQELKKSESFLDQNIPNNPNISENIDDDIEEKKSDYEDNLNETNNDNININILEKNDIESIISNNIIDIEEISIFQKYSKYFDSNGRRINRIINMYMLSREFFNKKVEKFISLINSDFSYTELILINIILSEQWPYLTSMLIVKLEIMQEKNIQIDIKNGLANWKNELISLKISELINITKTKIVNEKLKRLSYNDTRIDKFFTLINEIDNKMNSYNFFILQKYIVFNLNPSIRTFILKELNDLYNLLE
jgi:hypothetical protein